EHHGEPALLDHGRPLPRRDPRRQDREDESGSDDRGDWPHSAEAGPRLGQQRLAHLPSARLALVREDPRRGMDERGPGGAGRLPLAEVTDLPKMNDAALSDISDAIERQHGCRATFIGSVPVLETFQGATIWNGLVHVFRLTGHPTADRCYAWSYDLDPT